MLYNCCLIDLDQHKMQLMQIILSFELNRDLHTASSKQQTENSDSSTDFYVATLKKMEHMLDL